MSDPVRLAKRVVALLSCSRREAELYIAGGWVTVDGRVEEAPQCMVAASQQVALLPDATLKPVSPVTILFNQPPEVGADAGVASINADTRSAEDHSGIRFLKQHLFKLTLCLPLEPGAGGLSVHTQDWAVSRKLSADVSTIEQEYVVEVTGEMVADGIKLLNHGLVFNGKPLSPAKVSWQNETRLRFALKGVQPGQIRFACEQVGLQVESMRRLRIGRVAMGRLVPGSWRYLNLYERF